MITISTIPRSLNTKGYATAEQCVEIYSSIISGKKQNSERLYMPQIFKTMLEKISEYNQPLRSYLKKSAHPETMQFVAIIDKKNNTGYKQIYSDFMSPNNSAPSVFFAPHLNNVDKREHRPRNAAAPY